MNRNQRRMAAYNAKKAAEATNASRFSKKLTVALSGCSLNVAKATTLPSLREKHQEVAIRISTKYQQVSNEAGRQIHAVQKMRGKSMPPKGII